MTNTVDALMKRHPGPPSKSGRGLSDTDAAIAELCAEFYDDPYGWVLAAFPWGEPGTQLEGIEAPRGWQADFLIDLGNEIIERGFDGKTPVAPIQFSTVSGHGIGKSALVAMLILFIMSTRPDCRGVVTANTADQLRTKTWAELGKWHKLCITRHWFDWHGASGHLSLVARSNPSGWRVDGMTCREENSEAFAGLHAAASTPFYIFDESSAIPEKICEVASGGLTDGEPMWFQFGNGTRNTGFFRQTFGRMAHRWHNRQIDSRTVEGTNKEYFDKLIADYGENSDYVRVRVKGQFPSAGAMQFIEGDSIVKAQQRETFYIADDPLIIGVDVARGGDDRNVIYIRRGSDARSWAPIVIPGEFTRDTMKFVSKVQTVIDEHRPDAVFFDAVGVGGPVADRLRQMHYPVIDVVASETAPDPKIKNMRTYMWSKMRDSIRSSLALPAMVELQEDLEGPMYGHTETANVGEQLILEKKKDMKSRGLRSPDIADALALTFAYPVAARPKGWKPSSEGRTEHDYDPLNPPN